MEQKRNRPFTVGGKITVLLATVAYIFAIWHFTPRSEQWYFLGGIMFAYLLFKLGTVLLYRPKKNALTKAYTVSAIITCYKEDPEHITAIFQNILDLDYPVREIVFLDDGSPEPDAYHAAQAFANAHKHLPNAPAYAIHRFPKNRGKRAVLSDGIRTAIGDYIFLLDSDSQIAPNALTELLRPFEDGRTASCVGQIGILNQGENFVTKMQALTYYNSFQLGRAAQSVVGSVVVCSGAFSVHKRDHVLPFLDKLTRSKVFGIPLSAGDDRELTSYAQRTGGKTRYQCTAICLTNVPNSLRKFIAQRRRWQRSGYLGSLGTIRATFPKRPIYILWVFAEAYFWLVALIIFIVATMASGNLSFDLRDFIIFTSIVMYMHNGLYLLYRPLHFLLVPVYTITYGATLIFTRIHALVTIRNDGWGTRL